MDYVVFCKRFFAATGIPVNLLLDGKPVYAALGELLGYMPEDTWPMYPQRRNPEFVSMSQDLEYGRLHVEGTGYDLFLGPIFTSQISTPLLREYFAEFNIPDELKEPLTELLYALPVGNHPHFVRYMALLHLCLNHKDMDMADFYVEDLDVSSTRSRRELEMEVASKEEEHFHNSYAFERELYERIALGDTVQLKAFLETVREFPEEGKMARTPLRQAKNIFIGLVSKVAVMGAIPGGVDVERVYQLVDLYVLECEQLQSLEEVHRLQYIMLMDFCQRAGDAALPEGISQDIRSCMTYIRNHTNAAITIDEVADHVKYSSSYLMHRFKEETGISVGDFISRCKLEEAKRLLTYSQSSLSEISAYLGYSSQSYFQTVFKKRYGMTPMQYRKQGK